MLSRAVIT